MKIPNNMLFLKGFRYPREIISYAEWAYDRSALSTADVEDLLAEACHVGRECLDCQSGQRAYSRHCL